MGLTIWSMNFYLWLASMKIKLSENKLAMRGIKSVSDQIVALSNKVDFLRRIILTWWTMK